MCVLWRLVVLSVYLRYFGLMDGGHGVVLFGWLFCWFCEL